LEEGIDVFMGRFGAHTAFSPLKKLTHHGAALRHTYSENGAPTNSDNGGKGKATYWLGGMVKKLKQAKEN